MSEKKNIPEGELLEQLKNSYSNTEGEGKETDGEYDFGVSENSNVSLDELLERLKEFEAASGKSTASKNSEKGGKKQATLNEEEALLEEFEFDDNPIVADYYNYNIVGRGVNDDASERNEDTSATVTEQETIEKADEAQNDEVDSQADFEADETEVEVETEMETEADTSNEAESTEDGESVADTDKSEENTEESKCSFEVEKEISDGSSEVIEDSVSETPTSEDEDQDEDEDEDEDEDVFYAAIRERYIAEKGLVIDEAVNIEKIDEEVEMADNETEPDEVEPEVEMTETEESEVDAIEFEEPEAVENNRAEEETLNQSSIHTDTKSNEAEEKKASEEEEMLNSFLASIDTMFAKDRDYFLDGKKATEEKRNQTDGSFASIEKDDGSVENIPEAKKEDDDILAFISDMMKNEYSHKEMTETDGGEKTDDGSTVNDSYDSDTKASASQNDRASVEAETDGSIAEMTCDEAYHEDFSENSQSYEASSLEDEESVATAFGIKTLDSDVKPKKRGKGSATPIDDETAAEDKKAKKSYIALPSRANNGEYTSYQQSEYIKNGYRVQLTSEITKLGIIIAISILAFLIENFTLFGVEIFDISKHPIVAVILSTLIIIATGAMLLKELTDGAIMLFKAKPVPESFLLFAAIAPIIYYIITIADGSMPVAVFGLAFSLAALFCKLQTVLRIVREARSFSVVSAEKTKRVLAQIPNGKAKMEAEAFGGYVDPRANYYSVKRTLFTEDYFKLTNEIPRSNILVSIFIMLSFGFAAIMFLVSYLKTPSVTAALAYSFASFMYTIPTSLYLIFELPEFCASIAASKDKAAIIGKTASEIYSDEGVVSFSDSDIFPSDSISLVNIVVFGEENVEKLLHYTALVYDEISSPVKRVLMRSAPDYKFDDKIKIVGVYDSGIEAYINEEKVLVGSYQFMLSLGSDFPIEYKYEKTEFSQLFVSVGDRVLGKLDFEYLLDDDTAASLEYLGDSGFFVAIRTLDPNITPEFLSSRLDYDNCPIRLVKVSDDRELLRMRKSLSATVVTHGKTKSLMKALVLCGKSSYAHRVGMIFASAAFISGAVIMLISALFKSDLLLNGGWLTLLQLFWALPIVITSIFYVRLGKRRNRR